MPVVKEECFLGDAQKTRDEREDCQSVFTSGAHVQRLRVQLLHEVLQARHVNLIFDGLQTKNNSNDDDVT